VRVLVRVLRLTVITCSSLNSTLRTILARLHVSDADGFPSRGILSVIGILRQQSFGGSSCGHRSPSQRATAFRFGNRIDLLSPFFLYDSRQRRENV
jgi:hypothetical protein